MTDTYVPGSGPPAGEPPDPPDRAARVRARSASAGRVPPQALDAERATLGAMMLDSHAIATAVQIVMPDDFYRPAHRLVCRAIYNMFDRNEPVDIVTMAEELKGTGSLEKAGGEVALAELLDAVVTAAHIEYHAQIVREKSLLRQMIRAAGEIAEEAYDQPEDVSSFIDRAEHTMFEISEGGPRKGFVAVKDLLHDSFEKIERLFNEKKLVTGVPTGFLDLDTATAGFQPSDFIVIAARPSMGKTALTLNLAEYVTVEHKVPVAFFSLEMSKEALVQRLLSSLSRVDGNRLRTGFLRENEWPRLTTAAGRLGDAELYIDDTAGITALEVRAKARRLMVETGGRLAMVVVDYLQLIRGHGRQENRQQEIAGISRSLKALAKELRIPVVALSQLKRPTDVKEGIRRPVLSDLRECVAGDTRVAMADGRQVAIADLVGTEPEVVSIDSRGRVITAKSDRVWKVGRRAVFRIRLASGRTIRATAEHRLFGASGWVRVRDLGEGDRLAIAPGKHFQTRFLERVGGFGPRRAQATALAAALDRTATRTNVDSVPVEIFDRVRECMVSAGISQREMARRRGTSYGGTSHFSFSPSCEVLESYAEVLQDEALRAAARSDLFWDRIVRIEAAGEEDVFDLTVPGPASWLAGDIVSHNSGAIEQDADVVVFIHRPEVYGVQDKEGIAEIIIGKQRNGPIGIHELRFNKNITRFENLARVRSDEPH